MLTYHFFLTPRLIYDFTPISVLAAVLVAFGVLDETQRNHGVQGVRHQRLPSDRAGAGGGMLLSGGLFAFDHYWVPEADRRQDALRNEIKGKAPQTYLRPDRKWIYGLHDRVFLLQIFRPGRARHDGRERLRNRSRAFPLEEPHHRRARPLGAGLNAWVFQNGWRWDMDPSCNDCVKLERFVGGDAHFPGARGDAGLVHA